MKIDCQALLEAEQRRLREVKTIFCFIFIFIFITYIEYQRSALVSTADAESGKTKTFWIKQDFCGKNFPDKARKLRQFSNLRQMHIKGGFARFPDHTDIVLDHPNPL